MGETVRQAEISRFMELLVVEVSTRGTRLAQVVQDNLGL